ncbi:PadR family transcriptional regulator [Tepidibacter hydrothermalis]|uniref:PadR family transcriptional regulator n=1 Tax=Tepidibacter hydrothermalis TaxID=3036126 RepID=A0ABY8EAP9_9FIRM|nr:PadR family transcriptional regulator [Tepidibacter hydrothermalis]WFD08674.1 PadR family transcriptional regulator [Tepidibacter hydrothermalis]
MSDYNSLYSGDMTILILKLLQSKDMYGYEMISTLQINSNNMFQFKAGTLYPLLHSLVKQKHLNCYERKVNGKVRKYYSLTSQGEKLLQDKTYIWQKYVKTMASVLEIEVY